MELAGYRAVVTGAGGGLGEVTVRTLAAQHAHVLVADIDGDAADRVAAEVDGTAATADLSDDRGVDALIAAAGEDVDVLVNCAGGWSPTGRHYPDAACAEWRRYAKRRLARGDPNWRLRRPAAPARRR